MPRHCAHPTLPILPSTLSCRCHLEMRHETFCRHDNPLIVRCDGRVAATGIRGADADDWHDRERWLLQLPLPSTDIDDGAVSASVLTRWDRVGTRLG